MTRPAIAPINAHCQRWRFSKPMTDYLPSIHCPKATVADRVSTFSPSFYPTCHALWRVGLRPDLLTIFQPSLTHMLRPAQRRKHVAIDHDVNGIRAAQLRLDHFLNLLHLGIAHLAIAADLLHGLEDSYG